MVKPISIPIIICCAIIHIPINEYIFILSSICGCGSTIVVSSARPILTRLGVSFSPKMGATMINAKIRTKGKK
ncbi:hypothetical protein GAPWKB30_0061 [Gilliamella apicola]|nr:hypothetical protein GAPWKB30_0061 [Gilliamella apicola]